MQDAPLRRSTPCPWRPMTEAEWQSLSTLLRGSGRGRPPKDARRQWDGIFWVACSTGPWRDMPAEFGRADTAHRMLRRAAAARLLHRLLLALARRGDGGGLRGLEWFITRAFRRVFRVAPDAIAFARRLGFASALPAEPDYLPRPLLSESLHALIEKSRAYVGRLPEEFLAILLTYYRYAGGRPREWKTTG